MFFIYSIFKVKGGSVCIPLLVNAVCHVAVIPNVAEDVVVIEVVVFDAMTELPLDPIFNVNAV